MKVLLSAYACEPGRGSEPEVGLRAMLAAATQHDVWVLTRSNNLSRLADFLRSHSTRDRIHLVGVETSDLALWLKRKGLLPVQIYYDLWQRKARKIARQLDDRVRFDLIHHITFATFWARAGIASLHRPFVWGPVGGGVRTPRGFAKVLGWRGVLADATRLAVQELAQRAISPAWKRSAPTLVLAQNQETARKLKGEVTVHVLSNATAVSISPSPTVPARNKEVAFVGRLVPWKAGTLAVRVMSYVADPDAVLVVYGEGGEADRIAALAMALGVEVRFAGWQTRNDLLSSVARSAVLLHVSLREEAGLAVAEALSLGTPVVCLDHGGPAEIVHRWASVPSAAILPTSPDETARQLAVAIDGFLSAPAAVPARPFEPEPTFREEILRAYDDLLSSA